MKRRDFLAKAGTLGMMPFILPEGSVKASESLRTMVPAEHEPHAGTFMQWPVNRQVYRDRYFLKITQQTIANIANTIAEFEPVFMLADRSEHGRIRRFLSHNVRLWDVPTDDLWCRDSGPLFAADADGKLVVSHIQFNGWGGKQSHGHDKNVARKVAELMGLPVVTHGSQRRAGRGRA